MNVTIGNWTTTLKNADYGWFENDNDGSGGGLWFENKRLVDYDGVCSLPWSVVKAIRTLGYVVPLDMV